MGTRVIRLPDIGEGIAEAELVAWHVQPGDVVAEDQSLAEVMTDKATVEIPSPAAGTVVALGGEVGERLAVGGELVRLEVAGPAETAPAPPASDPAPAAGGSGGTAEAPMAAAAAPAPASRSGMPPAATPTSPTRDAAPSGGALAPAPLDSPAVPPCPQDGPAAPPCPLDAPAAPRWPPDGRPAASPAVRRRARQAGIDLRELRGSGPAGRIQHEDLDAVLRGGGARQADTRIEEVRLTGLRRRIAERMAEATRRVAQFSYIEEVDVTALEELRATLNAVAGTANAGAAPRLTLLPFLIRAMVRAVADFPQMNALYDDEAGVLRRHGGVHLGIATQTPAGLMVPVLRHAEARGLHACAAEAKRLAEAARQGRATREELTGSTITLSSLGALGGLAATPVVNWPEVAILGVNRIVQRPVWRDARVVPRAMMNLSASFDHRVVDGHEAARFVQRIKALLEQPALIFVEG